MISILKLKEAIINKIKEAFPETEGYKYYGVAVKEGFIKPCFFTQLLPTICELETVNTTDNGYLFTITYFQNEVDETDQLKKIDVLKRKFIGKIAVGERYVQLSNFDFEYIGKDGNVLQITFSITFKDVIEKQKTEQMIQEVKVDKELKNE